MLFFLFRILMCRMQDDIVKKLGCGAPHKSQKQLLMREQLYYECMRSAYAIYLANHPAWRSQWEAIMTKAEPFIKAIKCIGDAQSGDAHSAQPQAEKCHVQDGQPEAA